MSSPHRLLLIDQDPSDRSRAAAALMALFPLARLREVELGSDFFAALKDDEFDIVVTELETSWASWPFLLGAIRALQPRAAILVYTRDADAASHRAVLGAGASACVVKSDRGLLDLTQAVDRLSRPQDAGAAATAAPGEGPTAPPESDSPTGGSDARRPPAAESAPSAAREPSRPSRRPAGRDLPGLARSSLRSLRDREVGGPLVIFAGVVALTALLTVLLLGPGEPGGDRSADDTGPHGVVAGAEIEGPAPTPSTPVTEPSAPAAAAKPTVDDPPESGSSIPEARPPLRRALASDAPLALELRPRDEVWVRLYVDGDKVLENTLAAGDDRFYEGRETADLTVGNAAALTVLWNGTDLGNLGAEGQVRRLNFSPTRVGTGPARSPR